MRILYLFIGLIFATSAHADWRNDVGIFRIGLITERGSASTLERVEPFRELIAHTLNIEVEIFTSESAFTLIDALEGGRIEYAILPATSYALAWSICECVEPLVSPKAHDETDGYYPLIIATPGGPTSIINLPNARIGVLKKDSIIGQSLIINELQKQGINLDQGTGELVNFDTPTMAVDALVEGRIEALFGWSSLQGDKASGYSRGTLTHIFNHREVEDISRFTVLWKSKKIPHHPHVVKKKLDGSAKRILNDALLNLNVDDPIAYDAIEPLYSAGFSSSRHDLFNSLIEFWGDTQFNLHFTTENLKGTTPQTSVDENNTTGSNLTTSE